MEADRTLYIRNIPQDVSEALLYELFLQAGPIETVTIKGNIAFVTFEDEESVLYACSLFEGLQLYGVEIVIRPRAGSKFTNVKIRSVQPYSLEKHRSLSVQNPSPLGHQEALGSFMGRMLPGSRYQMKEPVGSPFLNSPRFIPPYRDHSNMISSASYPLLFPNWSPVFAPQSPLTRDWRSSSGSLLGPPSSSYVNGSPAFSDRNSRSVRDDRSRERSPFESSHLSRSNSHSSSHKHGSQHSNRQNASYSSRF